MPILRFSWGSLLASGLCLVLSLTLGSVEMRSDAAPDTQSGKAPEGRTLYRTYCASCHGVTGTGNGPAAASMRQAPPDLTGLALANGGSLPGERVRRIIDGREVVAHGDREMPVWGDAFKAMDGGYSEESVRARIRLLLDYLISIQRRLV